MTAFPRRLATHANSLPLSREREPALNKGYATSQRGVGTKALHAGAGEAQARQAVSSASSSGIRYQGFRGHVTIALLIL